MLCAIAKGCENCIIEETKICRGPYRDLIKEVNAGNDDEAVAICSMILTKLMIFADGDVNK